MSLGLGTSLSKSGLVTPGIVTDSLVLKHNYAAGGVVPLSDGAAYLKSASSQYIDMGSDSTLDTGTSDFSVSCWFNASTQGGTGHHDLVTKGQTLNDGAGWGISLVEDGKSIFFDTDGNVARQHASTAGVWSFNKWHHVAATRSNSSDTTKLYVDGVLKSTNASATNNDLDDAAKNFQIGNGDSSRYANGYICNVGFWKAALTQAQIKSIMWKNYAGLTSSETENLVSWWNLDSADGYTVEDLQGSNNGTLSGS